MFGYMTTSMDALPLRNSAGPELAIRSVGMATLSNEYALAATFTSRFVHI